MTSSRRISRIKKGHRLRVAIAGHDKDTFARILAKGTPVITAPRNRQHASFIELPIIPWGKSFVRVRTVKLGQQ